MDVQTLPVHAPGWVPSPLLRTHAHVSPGGHHLHGPYKWAVIGWNAVSGPVRARKA